MRTALTRLLAATLATATAGAGLLAVAAPAAAESVYPLQLPERLVTAPEGAALPYDPAAFGTWTDADGDGCDTRAEVLIAESTSPVTVGTGCSVTAGTWTSLYDGAVTSSPADLVVDHLVPLEEAWTSGASAWTPAQRRAFLNDLELSASLVAVTASSHEARSWADVAEWLPAATSAQCRYATEWALVKHRWNLTVDQAEREALDRVLPTCGSTPVELPANAGTPLPSSSPAGGDRMTGGQELTGGQWLMSPRRTHGLAFQADGNLVAYGPRARVLWSSGTYGNPGAVLRFQADGNAVIYSARGELLWHAGTYGNPGATLRVQDDGNVVVYRADGSAAWYTGWDRAGLAPGEHLSAGQQVTSPNGRYHLVLQRDGNAVVYHSATGRPLFFTGSYGAHQLSLQTDGNLVAYSGVGYALWSSGTWRGGRTRLAVQDDGNVVLYRPDGSPAWYSGWDAGQRATRPSGGTLVP